MDLNPRLTSEMGHRAAHVFHEMTQGYKVCEETLFLVASI